MGVGRNIETIAKKKGITIKEISERLGMPYTTFYNIVKRDSPKIDFELVDKLLPILDVGYKELLGESMPRGESARMELAATELHNQVVPNFFKSSQIDDDGLLSLVNYRRQLLLLTAVTARKYNVDEKELLSAAGMDKIFLPSEVIGEKEVPTDNEAIDRVVNVMNGMNDKGREAVLHHAEELSMIPEYKKE